MNRMSVPTTARRRARALAHRLRRDEDGQTLLLGLGLICVVLALLFVAASATAVYLDLKTLTSLADSAAGADSMDEHPYYGGGATDAAPGALTDMGVRSKAAEDLSAQPAAAKLEGITIVSARAADSQTAVVTLQARSRPPFLPWGIVPAEGFTITATGSARMTTTQ